MVRLLISGLALVAGVGVFILSFHTPAQITETHSLQTIEIADSFEEHMKGLSGRTHIPDEYGMLFVFGTKAKHGFWMKDMHVSIDIIWLSEEGEILSISEQASPESYPKTFYPPEPVKHVLETRAGLSKEKGWGSGTVLSLPVSK